MGSLARCGFSRRASVVSIGDSVDALSARQRALSGVEYHERGS